MERAPKGALFICISIQIPTTASAGSGRPWPQRRVLSAALSPRAERLGGVRQGSRPPLATNRCDRPSCPLRSDQRLHRRQGSTSAHPSTKTAAPRSAGQQQNPGCAHKKTPAKAGVFSGANDGARTRDTRNHNPVLYQLSYNRHERRLSDLPDARRQGGSSSKLHEARRSRTGGPAERERRAVVERAVRSATRNGRDDDGREAARSTGDGT